MHWLVEIIINYNGYVRSKQNRLPIVQILSLKHAKQLGKRQEPTSEPTEQSRGIVSLLRAEIFGDEINKLIYHWSHKEGVFAGGGRVAVEDNWTAIDCF